MYEKSGQIYAVHGPKITPDYCAPLGTWLVRVYLQVTANPNHRDILEVSGNPARIRVVTSATVAQHGFPFSARRNGIEKSIHEVDSLLRENRCRADAPLS
jgi:hypothetical protein